MTVESLRGIEPIEIIERLREMGPAIKALTVVVSTDPHYDPSDKPDKVIPDLETRTIRSNQDFAMCCYHAVVMMGIVTGIINGVFIPKET